jgi:xanthine dehydrogenase accessory factor
VRAFPTGEAYWEGYDAAVREVRADIERWRAAGERVALATVVATRRSAPRPIGSKLAVSASGELAGSVSGGCVENEVYGVAREVLGGAEPRLLTFGITDDMAFSVGLPCGGEIDVWVDEPAADVLEPLLEVVRDEGRAVVFTDLDGGAVRFVRPGADPLADELLRSGHSTVLELEGRRVFAEVYAPPPRLLVFGAIDTAEALCAAAKALGWRTIVADARARFATAERLPSADEIAVGWPEEALARVQPDHSTAVVVLTHDDKFDIPALKGVLETEAFYVGALGSRRNQARRRELLLEAGVPEDALERISGPCGLDIGASTPAETALSILAEILAVRVGRGGGTLKDAAGRIHAEVA